MSIVAHRSLFLVRCLLLDRVWLLLVRRSLLVKFCWSSVDYCRLLVVVEFVGRCVLVPRSRLLVIV